jgi:hypothetical protein
MWFEIDFPFRAFSGMSASSKDVCDKGRSADGFGLTILRHLIRVTITSPRRSNLLLSDGSGLSSAGVRCQCSTSVSSVSMHTRLVFGEQKSSARNVAALPLVESVDLGTLAPTAQAHNRGSHPSAIHVDFGLQVATATLKSWIQSNIHSKCGAGNCLDVRQRC